MAFYKAHKEKINELIAKSEAYMFVDDEILKKLCKKKVKCNGSLEDQLK